MIRFALAEDEQMLAEMAGDLATRTLAAAAAQAEADGSVATATVRTVSELGLLSVTVPEEAGGAGMAEQAALVVAEALARGDAAVALRATEHDLGLRALAAAGVDLPPTLVAGLAQVAFATGAVSIVDGRAHGTVVGPRRAAWLAIPSDALLLVSADDARPGAAIDDGGLRAAQRHQLTVSNATFRMAPAEFIRQWRLRLGAVAVGVGRAALAQGVEYATNRQQFGKPISSFQAIQWMLADSATELDAAWLLLRRAVQRPALATEAARMAVEAGLAAADRALQIHGGYGYTTEYPVARLFAAAQALSTRF